jgi:uncharacterized protein (TIGR02246 family)
MKRKAWFALVGLIVLVSGVSYMTAQDKTGKDPKREADSQAIKKAGQEYVKAFEKGDAKALAAMWTAEGEFHAADGDVIRGRTAIEKGYAELFAKKDARKIELEPHSIRFPSTDTAILEGTLRRKNAEGETVSSSSTHTLLVREGGQWKLALVHEWERDVSHDDTLKDLEWLIGTWVAAGKEKEVLTTYEWDEHKAWIRGKFTVKEGGKVIETGTQMIGKDNSRSVIRSWVFQSEGGFGESVWTRDGKQWTVEATGVLPDGREMTATNIYLRLGPDAWTFHSTNRTLGGVALPNADPIKVTRQKK